MSKLSLTLHTFNMTGSVAGLFLTLYIIYEYTIKSIYYRYIS